MVKASKPSLRPKEPLKMKSKNKPISKSLFSNLKTENIVKCLYNYQIGSLNPSAKGRFSEQIITEKLKCFYVYDREYGAAFNDRRITSLKFHPTDPNILAIGSKCGMLTIRFLSDKTKNVQWDGVGPGGSITYISFDPFLPASVLISSVDGTVRRHNYLDKTCQEFLSTDSFSHWYCSVNASKESSVIVTGDTTGTVTLLTKDLRIISRHKLHKKKVNSLEFPKTCGWLLASASLDNTVKLWDIRKIDQKSPLKVLSHVCPVNTASFSKANGNRLMTSDQYNEVRVYKGPLYDLQTITTHPHRQFQHLTPIKASWHPLCDLIVIGRYPDPSLMDHVPGELKTVDIISGEAGIIRTQLDDSSCGGICSLNEFNANGEILASAMCKVVNYWKFRSPSDRLVKPPKKLVYDDDSGMPPPSKRSKSSTKTKNKSKM